MIGVHISTNKPSPLVVTLFQGHEELIGGESGKHGRHAVDGLVFGMGKDRKGFIALQHKPSTALTPPTNSHPSIDLGSVSLLVSMLTENWALSALNAKKRLYLARMGKRM